MTFLVGVGAINTGNNLLYLLLGMMLGLILVSGVMSEAVLRRLKVERLSAPPLYAGQTATLDYRLTNGKRRLASFSIEVRELEAKEDRRAKAERKRKRDRKRRRRRGRLRRFFGGVGGDEAQEARRLEATALAVPKCFVHRVPASAAVVRKGRVRLARRGLYRYNGIALVTRFPFGFFEKSREIDRHSELLVFPRVVEAPEVEVLARRREGAQTRLSSGRGSEYHGLRDYRHGEDWRRIHWKVSARRMGLVVRENEQEHSRTLALVVAHTQTADDPPSRLAVERAIEVAAALARERIDQGFAVSLSTQAGTIPVGRGPAQMGRILRALALLEVFEPGEGPPLRPTPSGFPTLLVVPLGWTGAGAGQRNRADAKVVVDARGKAVASSAEAGASS